MCAYIKKNEGADVENMEQKNSNFISSKPNIYMGIVLAVHDTSRKPTRLFAILAPRNYRKILKKKYGFDGTSLQKRLRDEQEVHFCVPLSEQGSVHLSLKNKVVR